MSNDPADWDASTYCFENLEARDLVEAEADTLYEHGLRSWAIGPYLFIAGPVEVVARMVAWIRACVTPEAPLSGPAWSPCADVD